MKTYALIPARKGSKRLPHKNIRDFLGKPLIFWTIDAALEQTVFEKIVVSSDDFDLLDSLYEYDEYAECDGLLDSLVRPDELSTDISTMNAVIQHFIQEYELEQNDVVVVMYPTVPFRSFTEDAIKHFLKCDAKSLQTVTKCTCRPYGLLEKKHILSSNRDVYVPVVPEWAQYYRSQDGPPLYRATGGLYIMKVSELPYLNFQLFDAETIGFEVQEGLDTIDIDTEEQLEIAEFMAKKKGIKDHTIRGYFIE